jgi:hypothetical protein
VAGLSLNSVDSAPLYRKLLSYRAFPTGLFTGSAQSLSELRTLLEKTERAF